MKRHQKGVVGTCGEPAARRNIANIPRTKQAAFFLLDSIIEHYKNSGLNGHQAFDNPKEASVLVQKAIRAVSVKWVRKQKTNGDELRRFKYTRRKIRREQFKNSVTVFVKSTVPATRLALPALFGSGFLRKRVEVFPYGPTYTFNPPHRVNVYKQGSRFDVIDALCNIPILAGLTHQGLKKVVEW